MSIALGRRVCRRSVPTTEGPARATRTNGVRNASRTAASDVRVDQCPPPNVAVRCAAAAVRTSAIARASSLVARVTMIDIGSGCFGEHRREPESREHRWPRAVRTRAFLRSHDGTLSVRCRAVETRQTLGESRTSADTLRDCTAAYRPAVPSRIVAAPTTFLARHADPPGSESSRFDSSDPRRPRIQGELDRGTGGAAPVPGCRDRRPCARGERGAVRDLCPRRQSRGGPDDQRLAPRLPRGGDGTARSARSAAARRAPRARCVAHREHAPCAPLPRANAAVRWCGAIGSTGAPPLPRRPPPDGRPPRWPAMVAWFRSACGRTAAPTLGSHPASREVRSSPAS